MTAISPASSSATPSAADLLGGIRGTAMAAASSSPPALAAGAAKAGPWPSRPCNGLSVALLALAARSLGDGDGALYGASLSQRML